MVHNESIGKNFFKSSTFKYSKVVELHFEENRGFSGGVNLGIDFALKGKHDYVLFINNDARISADSLKILTSNIELDQKIGAVAPKLVFPDGQVQSLGGTISPRSLKIHEFSQSMDCDFISFACILVKCTTLKNVGFLHDAFFMYWEDVDFGLRVKAAGLDLVIVPEATAIHAVSSSRKIAGSRVDLYSSFGLGAFGILHPQYKFGSYYRITLRVLKRIALLQFSFAYKLWKAFIDGQKLDRPSYLRVTKENWPL